MHFGVADRHSGIADDSRRVLERPDAEGEIPVGEIESEPGGTRVVPDTCNPV